MSDAPGWEAIDAALARAHPGLAPRRWGTATRRSEGGPDPLDGISAYLVAEPRHWHFISYGLSELYAKTSPNKTKSGWGIELTLRVAADGRPGGLPADRRPGGLPADRRPGGLPSAALSGDEPPTWPLAMLQTMARYIINTRRPFGHAHYIAYGGPLAADLPTALEALLFADDPGLPAIDGPYGEVAFVQAFGLTAAELELLDNDNSEQLVNLVSQDNPWLVTDLERTSLLSDRRAAVRLRRALGVASRIAKNRGGAGARSSRRDAR